MPICFDSSEVDTTNGRLLKFGVRVPFREQAFQVLLALLDRPGELATREELRQRLWADATHVDFEAGLNTAMSRLRSALGDPADAPRPGLTMDVYFVGLGDQHGDSGQ
jgi:DNA-binding winged helix-turn-helix (wHTH) protein